MGKFQPVLTVALLLQLPPQPSRIVAALGPSLLQILSIRFQAGAASPRCLLRKLCRLQKATNRLEGETELVCDGFLSRTTLVRCSDGFVTRFSSLPALLVALLLF